ncbi:MAG: TonB-dependent receptor [Gemmatimonadales bacterium]|nr:TonB-dependent receptor [Gemmatimonadales bacterium]
MTPLPSAPAGTLLLALGLACAAPGLTAQARDTTARRPIELDTLVVRARRPTRVGPVPGLQLSRDLIPANVQSASGLQIRESQALNLNEFLNSHLQGVNVNDYQGNPFQMDVTYRGFSASPQIGTPQGLSVFLDGTRVNEPFGDVVNWDLLPLNAIGGLDLYSGSNPLFGLNTLGGALALRTRGGFTDKGIEGQALGGMWGRRQLQAAAGGSRGPLAGFVAGNWFEEGGWRDDSRSTVRQAFGRLDYASPIGLVTGTVLLADNNLIGNGLIPLRMFQARPEDVFSSPDQTRNRLAQFTLDGLFPIGGNASITVHAYRRDSERAGVNGDIFEDFQDFDLTQDAAFSAKPADQPWCRYADVDQDGTPDALQPAGFSQPGDDCYNGGTFIGSRNGASEFGFSHGSGVVDGTPIGLRTDTRVDQRTHGLAAQVNWNGARHKVMAGASVDASDAGYLMAQQLGLLDARRRVYLDPGAIDSVYRAAQVAIHGNDFTGRDRTASLYVTETWSLRDNLHLTVAARFNSARVRNRMHARGDEGNVPLGDLKNRLDDFILCPTADPLSCPDAPGRVLRDVTGDSIAASREAHTYHSLNPALGLTWQLRPGTRVYGNVSRGARSPSSIELGCAFDRTPVLINPDIPAWGSQPRSLAGPTCTLPTTLSGDPYLPQIRSTALEVGASGLLGRSWEWNASLYRTDLDDDIYFVGVAGGRSYFDNIGETRRQGLELGLHGVQGRLTVRAAYAYTDASFMSRFWMLSPQNSSADFNQNSRPVFGAGDEVGQFGHTTLHTANYYRNHGYGTFLMIRVDPGARMPGVPLHNLNLGLALQATRWLRLGGSMVARSSAFLRGNENNLHRARGTDQQVGQYYCAESNIDFPDLCEQYYQLPVVPGRAFTEAGSVPAHATFNLSASARLGPALTVSALLNNVFNHAYYSAGRLGINPFSPGSIGAIGPSGWNYNSSEWRNSTLVGPGAPRGFWLTLRYALGGSTDAD